MVTYIDPDKWVPIDNFTLEPAAIDVVKSQKNFYVIAGPGAGKTELLAQRASYLLQTRTCVYPRMILALSYKKDAEKNLRDRVSKRVGSELSSRFVSLTYDAFAKNILDRFRAALPANYQPDANYQILNINDAYEILFDTKLAREQRWDLHEHFVKNIRPLPIAENDQKIKWGASVRDIWFRLIKGIPRRTVSTLTFPVISILAEYIIRKNPRLLKALTLSYSHVFLDEFQDTTIAQYDLVSTCFKNTKDSIITAVGDDKQRIMVWAGAYTKVFDQFETDYKATKKILLMNFRSAPRLIAIQKMFMNLMFEEENPEIQWNKDHWQENDGESEVWLFNDDRQEAKIVAQGVTAIIKKEKITPRDVCVIVRQRPQDYTGNLIEELSILDVQARVENEYQDLLSDELTLLLVNLLEIGVSSRAPQAYLECLDMITMLRGVSANLDYDNKAQEVEKELTELQASIKTNVGKIRVKEHLHGLINQVLKQIGLSSITSMMPQYRSEEYRCNLITRLVDLLWKEYQDINNWELAIKNFRGENALPIMTIHKSKGLEFNTVIFIGLEDNAFWNFRRASEEEIRNFFVAFSRAKQRVIFTFTSVRKDKNNSASNIRSLYDALLQSKIVNIIDNRSS